MTASRLTRLRLRLSERFRPSEVHTMLIWAALVGFVGALATIAFREAIRALEWLVTRHSGGLVEIAEILPWYLRIVFPAVGGVVAGLLLQLSRRWAYKGVSSDYMEAISIGDGRIPVRQALARSGSSLFSVASGGSIGREGSMVHLAAMCASLIGRIARFGPARLRLLVACGAAAGITSAYSAPIGGALFVSEIVLGSIAMESFGPLVVASVVANITMRELTGYAPPYQMPAFPSVFGPEVLFFVALGLLAGAAAPQFMRALQLAKAGFARLSLPLPLRLGLGGLIVGLISARVPEVWGNGYSVVNSLLHHDWLWTMALLVLVCKILTTASTTGSGAIGGVFTPTLFVGASLGLLYGQGVHALWPQATSMPFAYAIVGMGAFLAGATHAPLMAILMIFEMTLSYQVVLPLMLACVVAYFVARAVREESMYEVTIHRNKEERALARWRGLQISELIKPAVPTVPASAGFDQVERAFLEHPVRYVYVVDEAGCFGGVVSLHELKQRLLAPQQGAPSPTAGELMRREFAVLTPDTALGDALQMFLTQGAERLPVVSSAADRRLLGVVSKSDLLLEIQSLTD
ncbi:MAG TPA: ClcB-like voltage-gated chloride channel protein [Burkholderiales bacterium]|nr:ClcB-like voltage-gated chloride channel protein [Burkholderiales bacterium]